MADRENDERARSRADLRQSLRPLGLAILLERAAAAGVDEQLIKDAMDRMNGEETKAYLRSAILARHGVAASSSSGSMGGEVAKPMNRDAQQAMERLRATGEWGVQGASLEPNESASLLSMSPASVGALGAASQPDSDVDGSEGALVRSSSDAPAPEWQAGVPRGPTRWGAAGASTGAATGAILGFGVPGALIGTAVGGVLGEGTPRLVRRIRRRIQRSIASRPNGQFRRHHSNGGGKRRKYSKRRKSYRRKYSKRRKSKTRKRRKSKRF